MDREYVSIGRLGAPKGVRGDLKVHSHSGESAHFRKIKEARLEAPDTDGAAGGAPGVPSRTPRALRLKVLRIEGEGPSLTIAFEGYPSPEAARALTGMEIIVPRAEAAPLRPNEWYEDDLVGLAIVDGSDSPAKGTRLGEVRSVLGGGAEPWLEVVLPGGGTAIVPFRKEFVGEVDIGGGSIALLVPELLSPDGRPDE